MWADEEFALIVVFANLLSYLWSYFCITSSLDRTSRTYDWMHEEVVWYAVWYSCQTFAFLVSITNTLLVSLVLYRSKESFVEAINGARSRYRSALVGLCVAGLVCFMYPASFMPYKLTLIETGRLDENIFIVWDD